MRLLDGFAQLSAAVNGTAVPELPTPVPSGHRFPNGSCPDGIHHIIRCPWAGLPAESLSGISPVAVRFKALMDALGFDEPPALLARRFARLLEETFKKPDEAQQIRRHFDAPATDIQPAGLPKPDGEFLDEPAPDMQAPQQKESWRNSPLSAESEQDGQSQTDRQLQSEQLEKPHD